MNSITFESDSPASFEVVPAYWLPGHRRNCLLLLYIQTLSILLLQESQRSPGGELLPLLPLSVNVLYCRRMNSIGQHPPEERTTESNS